jgi:hypothetical protein
MLWDLLAWWTINSARQFAPHDDRGHPRGSILLKDLLDRSFLTTHLLAVRRLCESPPRKLKDKAKAKWRRKRGVWSLDCILDDMQDHVSPLTRARIFRAERLRSNLAVIERDRHDELRDWDRGTQTSGKARRGIAAYNELPAAQQRHAEIDVLAGVAPSARSAGDQTNVRVLRKVRSRLNKACKHTCTIVNKFIAHAAAPGNHPRRLISAKTPDALFESAIVIKQTFDFVCVILGEGCLLLPGVELVDNLEHLDCPLIERRDLANLRRIWDQTKARLSAPMGDISDFVRSLG